MTSQAEQTRDFRVHCTDQAPANTHRVEARSFSEAAVTFLERWHVAEHAEEVSVIVEETHTGERHCFVVDLESGEAEPCA